MFTYKPSLTSALELFLSILSPDHLDWRFIRFFGPPHHMVTKAGRRSVCQCTGLVVWS